MLGCVGGGSWVRMGTASMRERLGCRVAKAAVSQKSPLQPIGNLGPGEWTYRLSQLSSPLFPSHCDLEG